MMWLIQAQAHRLLLLRPTMTRQPKQGVRRKLPLIPAVQPANPSRPVPAKQKALILMRTNLAPAQVLMKALMQAQLRRNRNDTAT